MESTSLFSPFTLRNLEIRNRIGVAPMCQYSAEDGLVGDWHLVHIGSRAVGGAGLVIMEATAVSPEGRISPACPGLWSDAHITPLRHITDFVKKQGAIIGIQLAHAGRKGSVQRPWDGGKPLTPADGGWQIIAPSAIPFAPGYATPREMSLDDIGQLKNSFVASAKRAVAAGFQLLEIHAAHGYLLHEFLSPLSNQRGDQYGKDEEGRFRLMLEISAAVRAAVPEDIVVGARLSCTDWTAGGLTIADTVRLSQQLKAAGMDFIDCSSGFVTPDAKIPFAPGFQVPFATEIRERAKIQTLAVGLITEPQQADDIIRQGQADMVLLARGMLRDPYWPLHAAQALGQKPDVPVQYLRGF